jgi:hypothetical protein
MNLYFRLNQMNRYFHGYRLNHYFRLNQKNRMNQMNR